MLHDSRVSSVPEEWTGDMFKDNWHDSLKQAKELVTISLDKIHREEIEWLNNKLQINQ